jgi:hypothetical protein
MFFLLLIPRMMKAVRPKANLSVMITLMTCMIFSKGSKSRTSPRFLMTALGHFDLTCAMRVGNVFYEILSEFSRTSHLRLVTIEPI